MISTSLSQSTTGIGLMFNLAYGYETYEVVRNPMLKSTSPSEFWGRRWNMHVHNGLKNGVYKPVRRQFSSRSLAVVATFLVSGVIHEYVNIVLFSDKDVQFKWKQMIFFGWNGVLILLEYLVGHWNVFRWLSKNIPQLFITALVILSALPLAHLFTGDWIKGGYFDDVLFAEPVIFCK